MESHTVCCMTLIVRDPFGVPVPETEFYMRWQRGNFALLTMDKLHTPQLQSREAFSSPQACMEHRRFVDPIPIGLPHYLMSKDRYSRLVVEQSYRLLPRPDSLPTARTVLQWTDLLLLYNIRSTRQPSNPSSSWSHIRTAAHSLVHQM